MGIDIDLGRMLMYAINVVILAFILTKLLYKPVSKYIRERQEHITKQLDEAALKQQQGAEFKEQYEELLRKAREESAELVRKGNEQGAAQAAEIVKAAQAQAKKLVEEAHVQIEKEREQAREQARQQNIDTAVAMAEQILRHQISPEDTRQVVDNFFERMG